MKKQQTDELRQELLAANSIEHYVKAHEEQFCDQGLVELLTGAFRAKSVSKAALAKRAGMSEVYVHQIFGGRRVPSREKLICLCIGMGCALEETQQLLKAAGHAALYAKSKWDSIVMYGIDHGKTIEEINCDLYGLDEKTLY